MSPKEFKELQLKELNSIKDWNKDWPTSNKMAPKVCVDCGRKLEKPKSKGKILMPISNIFPSGLISSSDIEIRIDCRCGACYIWSHPNIYLKTHRTMELLMDRYSNGELIRPLNVKL